MIDYRTLFAWRSVLQRKSLKALSEKYMGFMPEKRSKELFRRFLSRNNPIVKYYITPKTHERIKKMTLDNLELSTLSFLSDKFYKECGLFFFDSRVHCLYTITNDSVILLVMKGKSKNKNYTENYSYFQAKNFYAHYEETLFNNAVVGIAVIPFSQKEITITLNNNIYLTWLTLLSFNQSKEFLTSYMDKDTCKEVVKLLKYTHQSIFVEQKNEVWNVSKKEVLRVFSTNPKYYGLLQDYSIKSKLVEDCIKTFIFLKTAKVVDETFIPLNTNEEREYKDSDYGTEGVIKVDSFYNTNIDVIAPFLVRGHFRNQPKKIDGIWTREPVYIDTFMKKGYHRRAVIEKMKL